MLRKYDTTIENYEDEVAHLQFVAKHQPTKGVGGRCLAEASKIREFFEKPLEDHETAGTKRLGLKFVDRVIFNWHDDSRSEVSRERRWTEFMLIAEDGNHYEVDEISDSGRRSFPLWSAEEISERAYNTRGMFDEPTSECCEWEDCEAETNSSIWRAWNKKIKLGK